MWRVVRIELLNVNTEAPVMGKRDKTDGCSDYLYMVYGSRGMMFRRLNAAITIFHLVFLLCRIRV